MGSRYRIDEDDFLTPQLTYLNKTVYRENEHNCSRSLQSNILRVERYQDWIRSCRSSPPIWHSYWWEEDWSAHVPPSFSKLPAPLLPLPFNMGEVWYEKALEAIKEDLQNAQDLDERREYWSNFNIYSQRKDAIAEILLSLTLKKLQI